MKTFGEHGLPQQYVDEVEAFDFASVEQAANLVSASSCLLSACSLSLPVLIWQATNVFERWSALVPKTRTKEAPNDVSLLCVMTVVCKVCWWVLSGSGSDGR